jgi:hypothetical protein
MRAQRVDVGCGGTGVLAPVAVALRLLASVLLIGSMLLLVALVGQEVAGAGELTGASQAGPPPGGAVLQSRAAATGALGRYARAVTKADQLVAALPDPREGAAAGTQGDGDRQVPAGGASGTQPRLREARLEDPPRVEPAPERVVESPGEGGDSAGPGGQARAGSGEAAVGTAAAVLVAQAQQRRPHALSGWETRPLRPGTGLAARTLPELGPRQLGRPGPLDFGKATAGADVVSFPEDHHSAQLKAKLTADADELKQAGLGGMMFEMITHDRSRADPYDTDTVHTRLRRRYTPEVHNAEIAMYDKARSLDLRVVGGGEPSDREIYGIPPGVPMPDLNLLSEEQKTQMVLAALPKRDRNLANIVTQEVRQHPGQKMGTFLGLTHTGNYIFRQNLTAQLAAQNPPIRSAVLQYAYFDGDNPYGGDAHLQFERDLLTEQANLLRARLMMPVTGTRLWDWSLADPTDPDRQPLTPEREAVALDTLEQMRTMLNARYQILTRAQVEAETTGQLSRDVQEAFARNDQLRQELVVRYGRILGGGPLDAPAPGSGPQRGSSLTPEEAPEEEAAQTDPDAAPPTHVDAALAEPDLPGHDGAGPAADPALATDVFDNRGPVGSGGTTLAAGTTVPDAGTLMADSPEPGGDGGDGGTGGDAFLSDLAWDGPGDVLAG